MAIYSTFFICEREDLLKGFPGWKPPLAEPVLRETTNPFTREPMTRASRVPEWGDHEEPDPPLIECSVVSVKGSYEDYLENRIPSFVRERPHWCAKGFTHLELEPLGERLDLKAALSPALYSPPWSTGMLFEFHQELLKMLVEIDSRGMDEVAKHWAARMSTPEHTHSVTGNRLSEDWSTVYALSILGPIVRLAQQSSGDEEMYFLVE
jgi:hypothetical protein